MTSEQSEHRRRSLPHRLRLLCIGPTEPPWALLALRLETAGCDQAEFDWQSTSAGALARLRTTAFDCILVIDEGADQSGKGAIELVEGLRTSGGDDPVVILLHRPDDDRTIRYEDLDCELLVTTAGWQSRAVTHAIRRAIARCDLFRDVAGLEQAAHRGRVRERDGAETQLRQLRDVVAHLLQPSSDSGSSPSRVSRLRPAIGAKIEGYYRELLRTYVMMGSGNLAAELTKLAELLSLSGVSPHEALAIHLDQVETLIGGLGSRSSRHVMARADLLALELMIHLGEDYRQKAQFRGLGDAGVDLLHAESLLQRSHE